MGRWRVSSGCIPTGYGTVPPGRRRACRVRAGPPRGWSRSDPHSELHVARTEARDGGRPVVDVELREHVLQVPAHRPGRDPELPGDLGVRHAFRHEHDHFALPRCQPAAHAGCPPSRSRTTEAPATSRRSPSVAAEPIPASTQSNPSPVVGCARGASFGSRRSARSSGRRTTSRCAAAIAPGPCVARSSGRPALSATTQSFVCAMAPGPWVARSSGRTIASAAAAPPSRRARSPDRRAGCEPLECRVQHGSSSVR